ncbi:arabinosyltransferase domain-containing protein [Gordonia sp. (in: high G+C Gram-positive bacteria)]|uniref:arabinosyltransferase domain-containing protein n=1 Tax=Gordonia sp. (in: high G+C Gram-positive bacteria) TaxID=84139 RepID=UPI0016AD7099|nr:arabinosyltransferase domain-containing protein [Gordonia sp. (in: high G+C Gram-positive bacteria)]NLG46319.1 arabinosyltransferase [Gordonia sp. (in: high G+C Gram-positive bacteria)]
MSTSQREAARRYSVVATIAGLVAIVAALATPFLPVTAQSASIDWPNGQQLATDNGSVVAPLAAQTANDLTIAIGCSVLQKAAASGTDTVIVATAPSSAPREIRDRALSISAGASGVRVVVANSVLATADRAALNNCQELKFWADESAMGAQFVGSGPPARGDPLNRPLVAGVFTSLSGDAVRAAQADLSVHIDVDNAFDVSRTWIKTAVIVIGVIAALIALIALAKLDAVARLRGVLRSRRRLLHLAAPSATDLVVTAALVVWHFLAAGTSDDGYIQVMGRNASDAGYLSDYYRFFGIAEAPFDWYYSFLSHWATISSAGIWMRLPALVAGLLSWFILSRVLIPRLGPAVRGSKWAVFSGAAVFVAFWIAFCSGLRAEPIIVLGSLVTWWLVESAIATRRLLPAALATFAALLTLAAGPQGVVAVAVLIVGSRPMLRIVRSLRREYGLLPLFASLAAAASLIVFLVFRTQTLANVVEAIRVRYTVGPTLSWYQELMRYYFMTVGTPDGALMKRIPVLLLVVALGAGVSLMLRHRRLAGFAPGPVWRLIGAVLLTIGLLSFVPTKWTVQFGVFAGIGAALTVVATAALIAVAGNSPRVLWTYVTVLLGACAVATSGNNAWGWGYDYGIPWFDKPPVIAGQPVSTLFLGLTAVSFAVLLWVCVRPTDRQAPTSTVVRRRRLIAGVPVVVITAALVLGEFALFGRAALDRSDTYTAFSANMRALSGNTCGMADRVLVEPNANAGMLQPVAQKDVSKTLAGESVGFTPDGVAFDLDPEPVRLGAGTIHTAPKPGSSYTAKGAPAGTTGGFGPRTINGSTVALPFGLDPATTPVLGSHGFDNGTASLTSDWYRLPQRDASPLIVISAAGSIFSVGQDGAPIGGRDLKVEFGTQVGGEFQTVGAPFIPIDAGPDHANRPWRNLRIPMAAIPANATTMRIVAVDSNLNPDEWLAVTPPRAPRLSTLQEVVGSDDPVLLDLSVGSQFPCQQPITARDGVFTVPQWRITPDRATTFSKSKSWQRASAGGILAVSDALTQSSTVATYLENDWYRDWGNLLKLTPLVPEAPPAHLTTTTSRQFGWHTTSTIVTGEADD